MEPSDPFDVLIIGAGVSGIGMACHLARECPHKRVAILERRGAIGGTWDLFRYPGVRSDSDMMTFGYRLRPWTEARVLARLADELDLDCWVTFSCRNGFENCEGTPIADCAREAAKFKSVCAVGVNCTAPVYIESLIKEIRAACGLPVIVYPNSGEEYDPATKTWHGAKDGLSHADYVRKWIAAGAKVIGGCCRTRPAEVREIYEIVKKVRDVKSKSKC